MWGAEATIPAWPGSSFGAEAHSPEEHESDRILLGSDPAHLQSWEAPDISVGPDMRWLVWERGADYCGPLKDSQIS